MYLLPFFVSRHRLKHPSSPKQIKKKQTVARSSVSRQDEPNSVSVVIGYAVGKIAPTRPLVYRGVVYPQ